MSETLRERDLTRVRDACIDGSAAGNNDFELMIVPLTGNTLDDWPEGFADAVRSYCELPKSRPIFPGYFYLLPYFSTRKSSRSKGPMKPFNGIVGNFAIDRPIHHRLAITLDGSPFEVGTILRTFSRRDEDGKLLPGETAYLRFMSFAGRLLNHHGIVRNADDLRAWLTFLAEYVWTHKRPKISQGFATVENLWKLSLEAIDEFLGRESAAREKPSKVPKSRGRPKTVSNKDEGLLRQWENRDKDVIKTRKDFAKSLGRSPKEVCSILRALQRRRMRGKSVD